jgi:hypothetical protein
MTPVVTAPVPYHALLLFGPHRFSQPVISAMSARERSRVAFARSLRVPPVLGSCLPWRHTSWCPAAVFAMDTSLAVDSV